MYVSCAFQQRGVAWVTHQGASFSVGYSESFCNVTRFVSTGSSTVQHIRAAADADADVATESMLDGFANELEV